MQTACRETVQLYQGASGQRIHELKKHAVTLRTSRANAFCLSPNQFQRTKEGNDDVMNFLGT